MPTESEGCERASWSVSRRSRSSPPSSRRRSSPSTRWSKNEAAGPDLRDRLARSQGLFVAPDVLPGALIPSGACNGVFMARAPGKHGVVRTDVPFAGRRDSGPPGREMSFHDPPPGHERPRRERVPSELCQARRSRRPPAGSPTSWASSSQKPGAQTFARQRRVALHRLNALPIVVTSRRQLSSGGPTGPDKVP
jgi:hypothetical protein